MSLNEELVNEVVSSQIPELRTSERKEKILNPNENQTTTAPVTKNTDTGENQTTTAPVTKNTDTGTNHDETK